MAFVNTRKLALFGKDSLFSHAGSGAELHTEKLTALQKQMKVGIYIYYEDIERTDFAADPIVDAKNFTNGEYTSLTCVPQALITAQWRSHGVKFLDRRGMLGGKHECNTGTQ